MQFNQIRFHPHQLHSSPFNSVLLNQISFHQIALHLFVHLITHSFRHLVTISILKGINSIPFNSDQFQLFQLQPVKPINFKSLKLLNYRLVICLQIYFIHVNMYIMCIILSISLYLNTFINVVYALLLSLLCS